MRVSRVVTATVTAALTVTGLTVGAFAWLATRICGGGSWLVPGADGCDRPPAP